MLKICKLFNLLRVLKSVYMFLFLYFSVFQYFYIYFGNGGYLEFCVGNFPVKTRSLVKVDWSCFFNHSGGCIFVNSTNCCSVIRWKSAFNILLSSLDFATIDIAKSSLEFYISIFYIQFPIFFIPYVVSMQICVLRPSDQLRAKSS